MKSACLLLLLGAVGCATDDEVPREPSYLDQPGFYLREGGELRHEHVQWSGMPEKTFVLAYQLAANTHVQTAPYPTPAEGGLGLFGTCTDERQKQTWPFTPLDTTFLALAVSVNGPGLAGALPQNPPDVISLSTFRQLGAVSYGGDPLPAEASTLDADYTLDIGDGDPVIYHIPAAYTPPLGIGVVDSVMIRDREDLELTWPALPQDYGPNGDEITRFTHFNYTLFIDPSNAASSAQFLCFPDVDGHLLIPSAVIERLPTTGLIVNANFSQLIPAKTNSVGETNRFDVVSTNSHISLFQKQ